MKKTGIVVISLLVTVLATWGIYKAWDSDRYEYQGYIIDVSENPKGDTVLKTVWGTEETSFTVKWYSRVKGPKKQPFGVGDRVFVSSTYNSENAVKRIKSVPGYATEGTLIYTKEQSEPLILAVTKDTGRRYVVRVTPRNASILSGLKTGDTVRICHSTPVYAATPSVTADSAILVKQGAPDALSAEAVALLESLGYTLDP